MAAGKAAQQGCSAGWEQGPGKAFTLIAPGGTHAVRGHSALLLCTLTKGRRLDLTSLCGCDPLPDPGTLMKREDKTSSKA